MMVAINPKDGPKGFQLRQFNRTVRQVLLLPVGACVVLCIILIWQIQGANHTVGLIELSDQRIMLTTQVEKLVVDEETGLRGFQITSDARFLEPYYAAQAPLVSKLAQLQAIVKPEDRNDLAQFVQEHEIWKEAFAEPTIADIRAGGQNNDDELNMTGRQRMNHMRSLLDGMVSNSVENRGDRVTHWESQIHYLTLVLVVLSVAIGALIGIFTRNRIQEISKAFGKVLGQERRRTQELFESEQNLRTTLASIGDGVITCDVRGRVQMMNPVAQELTGWLESEAVDRPLEDVFHIVNESSRVLVESPVAKVQRLNRVVGMANHTVLIRKDGSEIAIDDSGAPIRNESGDLIGIVMVFRDVTLDRRTRAALLASEKLAVAGRLAATIAHEIHNPLDSVSNLLYLLQQDPNDAEAKHFLEMAQSELARVTQISRAMLSLYRESKAPVPVNLRDMLSDVLLLMEPRLEAMRVKVSSDLPDITVDGFPAELRQVFTNLITNAAEAAGDGGHIEVSVKPQQEELDDAGQKQPAGAVIEVTDSGPGISPEVRERLFQPFVTTKGEHGTGLGLWVSQGIIRKHGGTLELSDNPQGPGALARIFLAAKPVIDLGGD